MGDFGRSRRLGRQLADGSLIREQEIQAVRELYGEHSLNVTRLDFDGVRGPSAYGGSESPDQGATPHEAASDPSEGAPR